MGPDDRRFHLVLAHGIDDGQPRREEVRKFWSTRFQDALVTDFPFAAGDFRPGTRGFVDRARSLIEKIQADREGWYQGRAPRCVFLCHDLGGSLVQQGLVLAAQDRKYHQLADNVALLIFCNRPGRRRADLSDETHRELELLQLFSQLKNDSRSPLEQLGELPAALEELSWAFASIERHYAIVDVTVKPETAEPRTNDISTDVSPDRTILNIASPTADLWNFFPGEPTAERVFDIISRVVRQENQEHAKQFYSFIQAMLNASTGGTTPLRLSRPYHGSLQWLRQHSSYVEWERQDPDAPSILYIHGPPGSGSTIVASHLVTTMQAVPHSTVISFSFSKQDLRTLPIIAFYTSLIRQLLACRPSLFRSVSAAASWMVSEDVFGYEILRNLFLSLLKGSYLHPIVCVIHGAQDCEAFELDHLVELLREHRRLSSGILKLAVLDQMPRQGNFKNASDICRDINLSDQDWHSTSLEPFVRSRVERLVKDRPEWDFFKDDVVNKLCQGRATFLQTSFAMKLLETARISSTRMSVSATIDCLPSKLDEMFTVAYDRCQAESPVSLLSLLRWATCSVRPLTLYELAVVMALTAPGRLTWEHLRLRLPLRVVHDLRVLDGTLIKISGLQVYPIHSTISLVLSRQWRLRGEDPDGVLLSQCLDYLEMMLKRLDETEGDSGDEISLSKLGDEAFDLLAYAVMHWPEHHRRAGDRLPAEDRLRVSTMLNQSSNSKTLFKLHQIYAGPQSSTFPAFDSPLTIASRFGLADIARNVVSHIRGSEDMKEVLSDALNLAAGYGHQDVVDLLLEEGAQSDEAICLAASGNYLHVVEALVSKNPETANNQDRFGRSAFLLAALNGAEKTAAYLLGKGANCHVTAGSNLTALHVAAMTGQSEIVHSLIDAEVDVNAVSASGYGALMIAAGGGFDDAVTLLLGHGAQIDKRNEDGETPLHRAIEHGHASTTDILIEAGADILAKTKAGMSPIHLASKEGYIGILRGLITKLKDYVNQDAVAEDMSAESESNNGTDDAPEVDEQQDANPEAPAETGSSRGLPEETKPKDTFDTANSILSPLQLAASRGHLNVVRELLKYPRYNSEWSRSTALLLAAEGGFGDMVAEFLKSGTLIVIKDADGNNALHLATKHQYPDIVTQLLAAKSGSSSLFDVDLANNSERTPLHLSAESGRLLTIKILLECGANPNRIADDGQTALHIAAFCGHLYVARELLRHMQDDKEQKSRILLCADTWDHTAFTLAVQKGHLDVCQLLLNEASSIANPMQLQGQKNALNLAAVVSGHEQIVQLLIDSGWDVNAGSGTESTALHLAADWDSNASFPMFELLMKHGANPNAKDAFGTTPLHIASKASRLDAVKALLQGNADINAVDSEGATPLWRAAYGGRSESITELLTFSPDLEAQKTDSGWTALHAAYDSPMVTKILIDAGANPRALDSENKPPFFLAADYWHGAATLQVYLDAEIEPKLDLNWALEDGMTALHIAAQSGTPETVRLLIDHGAEASARRKDGVEPLHLAALSGSAEKLEIILGQHGVDPNLDSRGLGTPLMAVTRSHSPDAVKILLEKGAEVNVTSRFNDYHTAIQAASWWGYADVIEVLLQGKADVNITGGQFGSALLAAVLDHSLANATRLLEAGADINFTDSVKGTALECALMHKEPGIVDLFMETERKVDVNAVSKNEKCGTPLIAAVWAGDAINVKRLLERGADANLPRTSGGETPVQVAVRIGRLDVLEDLVKSGAKLFYTDPQGRHVLSHAIHWKSTDLLPFLWMRSEIDINEQDTELWTPLIIAIRQGSLDVVGELVARKANLDMQDRRGYTALMHAVQLDYESIVSDLIEAGADPLVKDAHGRDALYWAARSYSGATFSPVIKQMRSLQAMPSVYQNAISAAIAVNKVDLVEVLLDEVQYSPRQADQDGWTALYTAQRYCRPEIQSLIEDAMKSKGRETIPLDLKLPTSWELQPARGMLVQPNNRTITVIGERFMGSDYGIARANHPMIPCKDGIYYFEATIVDAADGKNEFGVGFCEEHAPLDIMLGWREGSWGYHGDNGLAYTNGERGGWGTPYGPLYGQGDTIGCGVNFKEGIAFYTKNEEIIGRAFTGIRGKLFPAIAMDLRVRGSAISVEFWERDDSLAKFKFKGPFTGPKTLVQTQLAIDAAAKSNSDSDGGNDSSGSHSDSDSD